MSKFFTASILFISFLAQGCPLSQVVESPLSANQLLKLADQKMNEEKSCEAAIALTQACNQYPMQFVLANGLFTLIHLEMDLHQYSDALRTYKSWPWEIEKVKKFNPWKFVPEEQADGTRLLIWQLFARFIPKDAETCLDNPLTHQCDEANGLYNYDQIYAQNFPSSPFLSEMQKVTSLFYDYKIKHEKIILNEYIQQYRHSSAQAAQQWKALSIVLFQTREILKIAKTEDQEEFKKILTQYTDKMNELVAKNPKIETESMK